MDHLDESVPHQVGLNNRQSGMGSGTDTVANYEWNHLFVDDEEEEEDDDEDGERTPAIVLAGEGKDLVDLYVPTDTTHLLLGASNTPNQLPSFLVNNLPSIANSLLALDISANYLASLPHALAACRNLEELDIGSNPLRVLPPWLAVLTNLRVFITDSTGISTIPSALSGAVQLHTLSARNNRMHYLPSWLCLLPALEVLYLEGNPFQGPWKALVEPLITLPTIAVRGPMKEEYRALNATMFETPSVQRTIRDSAGKGKDKEWGKWDFLKRMSQTPNSTESTTDHSSFNSNATLKIGGRPSTAGSGAPVPREPISPRPFSTHDAVGSRSLSQAKTAPSQWPSASSNLMTSSTPQNAESARTSSAVEDDQKQQERHQRALRSVMGYLKDMCDLSAGTSAGAAAVAASVAATQAQVNSSPNFAHLRVFTPVPRGPSKRSASQRPVLASADAARPLSNFSMMTLSTVFAGDNNHPSNIHPPSPFLDRVPSVSNLSGMFSMRDGVSLLDSEAATLIGDSQSLLGKRFSDDRVEYATICKEIVSTEQTYVKLLQELMDIYVAPASAPVTGIVNVSTETIVPTTERKIVFGGLESLLSLHRDSFLPSLEKATMGLYSADDVDGQASTQAAIKVAQVFVSHAAFMRMYSAYINNFDNALHRTKQWIDEKLTTSVGSGDAAPNVSNNAAKETVSSINLSSSQRRRIKQYLKKCRAHPQHSLMNIESYLLLPVQRIPYYRLMFEALVYATAPPVASDKLLQRALDEITMLTSNMNEGKREAKSRRKLIYWQGRIRGKFPSPLVQPHRRFLMDGNFQLTRVVRKLANYFEVINASGEKTLVSVECLAPEVTPRPLVAILCSDLLVLCKDPSGGTDPTGPVDLWAILRMQTVPQPASVVHGRALRLVDNKAILYFDLPSTTEALTWARAINMHIPASSK